MKTGHDINAKLGSKENPILLPRFRIDEISDILWEGDQKYESAGPWDEKYKIREEYRALIFAIHPEVYDNCHIAERPCKPFEHEAYLFVSQASKKPKNEPCHL